MEATQATAGLLPTKVKEWLLRMRYAFVGANLPEVDQQIETLRDAANTLAETVEELEEFKFDNEKWRSSVMEQAYDVIDEASHRNSTEWISHAMQRVLMRDDFLDEEKKRMIEMCVGQQPQYVDVTRFGMNHFEQAQVTDILAINTLKDDLAYMMVSKILADLPSMIKVSHRVSEDSRAETFCELTLEPKRWVLRNPRDYRMPALTSGRYSDRMPI